GIYEGCTNRSSSRKSTGGDAIENICSTMTLTTTYDTIPTIITEVLSPQYTYTKISPIKVESVGAISPTKIYEVPLASKYTATITTVYCKGLIIPDCDAGAGIYEGCTNRSSSRKSTGGDAIENICSTMTLTTTYDTIPTIITEVLSPQYTYTKISPIKVESVGAISPTKIYEVPLASKYTATITTVYCKGLIIPDCDAGAGIYEGCTNRSSSRKSTGGDAIENICSTMTLTTTYGTIPTIITEVLSPQYTYTKVSSINVENPNSISPLKNSEVPSASKYTTVITTKDSKYLKIPECDEYSV
ncbi:hypothetical protein AYI69_g7487, partial [Smittium culicis]